MKTRRRLVLRGPAFDPHQERETPLGPDCPHFHFEAPLIFGKEWKHFLLSGTATYVSSMNSKLFFNKPVMLHLTVTTMRRIQPAPSLARPWQRLPNILLKIDWVRLVCRLSFRIAFRKRIGWANWQGKTELQRTM